MKFFATVAFLAAAPLLLSDGASSLDVDQLLRKRQRGARRVQAEEVLDVELGSMSMDQTQTYGGAHSSKSSKNSKKGGGDVPIPPCVFASPALAVSSNQQLFPDPWLKITTYQLLFVPFQSWRKTSSKNAHRAKTKPMLFVTRRSFSRKSTKQ